MIGGSITEGASATAPERRWANRFAAWWGDRFRCPVAFVNAGRGATGSLLGAHRVRRDLLAHRPDVVVCEYAVNDAPDRASAETFEGLVRQILAEPHAPAVLVLTTVAHEGRSAQEQHAAIASHYGLPLASYRDAVWPRVQRGEIRWADVAADDVHPNDQGHALCATLLAEVVDRTLANAAYRVSTVPCRRCPPR
ncbi:MAG TPA: SGNH/GDSL hydrolase family protein [Tepidisphaeraceae bacterium]|nr:SGNH/GDSL hydrolase family protein [Tepidisphaeraceae bacterium]